MRILPALITVAILLTTTAADVFAATYYVSVDGDDAAPGTEAQPVRTILRGAELAQAGDTVIVGNGRYNEYILVPNSGEPGKPITFRAAEPGKAVVTASFPLEGLERVEGTENLYSASVAEIYGVETTAVRPGSSNLPKQECYGLVDNSTLTAYTMLPSLEACDAVPGSFMLDRNALRIYVHFTDDSGPDQHQMELCTLYGTFYVSGKNDIIIEGFTIRNAWRERGAGVTFAHKSQRCILRDSRIENCWHGFVAALDAEDCAIENCEVINCPDGIRFEYLHRGRVVGNTVVRRGDNWPWQPAKPSVGIYFYCFYTDGDNMSWIENNYVENFGDGFRLKAPHVAVCRNNTIVDCPIGIQHRLGFRRDFVNNIFVNCDQPFAMSKDEIPPNLISDYNLFYSDRPERLEASLQAWREMTGQDQHSVTAAPKILGRWPEEMLLAPTSPCLNAGQDGATIGSLPAAPLPAEDKRPPVGSVSCGAAAGEWRPPSASDRQREETLLAQPWRRALDAMRERAYVGGEVTLKIDAWDAEGSVTRMRFSNDGQAWSEAVPYVAEAQWALTEGDGEKTVYAQFEDEAGNWSEPISVVLHRKEQAPTIGDQIEVQSNRYGARISWASSEPCEAILHYGPTADCARSRRAFLLVDGDAARHVVFLTDEQVDSAQPVYYRVELRDTAGNSSTSEVQQLRLEGEPRTLHVSPAGDDGGDGSEARPWRTLATAAVSVLPGDTVLVGAGLYYEPLVVTCGGTSEESRVTWRGEPGAIIERAEQWPYGVVVQGLKFVTIEGFEIRGFYQDGVNVSQSTDIIVADNVVHSGYAERLTQRKPYVGDRGIVFYLAERCSAEGNTLWWNCTDLVFYYTKNCRGDHNTISDSVYQGVGVNGPYENLVLTNNIIAFNGNDQISITSPPGDGNTIFSDYNCWLKDPRSKRMSRLAGQPTQTLAELQQVHGTDANSIEADPLFTDLANGVLTLEAGSPCFGAGEGGSNIGAQ